MRATIYSLALLFALAIPASPQTRIDAISTTFRWFGPNDKIVVERYDVTCRYRRDQGWARIGRGPEPVFNRLSGRRPNRCAAWTAKVRGDRIRLCLTVFQIVPNPSRI